MQSRDLLGQESSGSLLYNRPVYTRIVACAQFLVQGKMGGTGEWLRDIVMPISLTQIKALNFR
jgi:hypothetical protein